MPPALTCTRHAARRQGDDPPALGELESYRVTGRGETSLWDNALVFVLLLIVLGLEWWWRRGVGLR